MTKKVSKLAPKILAAINRANNILMHCHPSPDGDSVGGSLAMMHYLQAKGKSVTVISGDSELPLSLAYLPGFDEIINKNYLQVDTSKFDLFIAIDAAALGQIIYDLLKSWKVHLTKEMAACLFTGIYSDTGGFKYMNTTSETFMAGAELTKIHPDFCEDIFEMENNNTPGAIAYRGLALSSVELYFNGRVAISAVPLHKLKEVCTGVPYGEMREVSNALKSVTGWEIGIALLEKESGKISLSFRTRDPQKYDVSKIAAVLGGGGHKAAGGATLDKPFLEAKKYLIKKFTATYPGLGKP